MTTMGNHIGTAAEQYRRAYVRALKVTANERQHRVYVRGLKAQITPEALSRATAQVRGRERVKVARKASKTAATVGALGLGAALIVGLARAGRTSTVLATTPGSPRRGRR
jgi:hypothetical protein